MERLYFVSFPGDRHEDHIPIGVFTEEKVKEVYKVLILQYYTGYYPEHTKDAVKVLLEKIDRLDTDLSKLVPNVCYVFNMYDTYEPLSEKEREELKKLANKELDYNDAKFFDSYGWGTLYITPIIVNESFPNT